MGMDDLQKQIEETQKEVLVEVIKVARTIYPEAYNRAFVNFLVEGAIKGIKGE
jgi:hypothetical protein